MDGTADAGSVSLGRARRKGQHAGISNSPSGGRQTRTKTAAAIVHKQGVHGALKNEAICLQHLLDLRPRDVREHSAQRLHSVVERDGVHGGK